MFINPLYYGDNPDVLRECMDGQRRKIQHAEQHPWDKARRVSGVGGYGELVRRLGCFQPAGGC